MGDALTITVSERGVVIAAVTGGARSTAGSEDRRGPRRIVRPAFGLELPVPAGRPDRRLHIHLDAPARSADSARRTFSAEPDHKAADELLGT